MVRLLPLVASVGTTTIPFEVAQQAAAGADLLRVALQAGARLI